MSKLHEVSSDPQGIVTLCAVFENLVRILFSIPQLFFEQVSNFSIILFCSYKHMNPNCGPI